VRRAALLLMLGAVVAIGLGCGGKGQAGASRHPPVVMIVLDELSTTSLVDSRHRIDPVRQPNFARLAGDGTWFPNATASLDETGRAMRALLTGRTTWQFARPPTRPTHETSCTLMARRYRLIVSEEVTSLCPRRLCPSSRAQTRRSVLRGLGGGRPERLARWLRGIRPSSQPTFYFKHILLPHAPWRYLPSGRSFPSGPTQRRCSWNLQPLQSLAREPELPAAPAPGRVHRPAARQGARPAPRDRPVRPLAGGRDSRQQRELRSARQRP
jgi:hypothetical protein